MESGLVQGFTRMLLDLLSKNLNKSVTIVFTNDQAAPAQDRTGSLSSRNMKKLYVPRAGSDSREGNSFGVKITVCS